MSCRGIKFLYEKYFFYIVNLFIFFFYLPFFFFLFYFQSKNFCAWPRGKMARRSTWSVSSNTHLRRLTKTNIGVSWWENRMAARSKWLSPVMRRVMVCRRPTTGPERWSSPEVSRQKSTFPTPAFLKHNYYNLIESFSWNI